jgi:hypothetical protein
MSQAIDALSDLGVVFVFSAGNNAILIFTLRKHSIMIRSAPV